MLGSGSRGNAIALRADGATLLIDAGFGPRTVARRARAVATELEPLHGIVVTHEHGDHARAALRLAARFGCSVYASQGTLAALAPDEAVATGTLTPGYPRQIGPFTVHAAASSHDANEPLAIAVSGPNGIKVGIAYDLGRPTAAVRYLLRGCAALVLEANHDDVLLRTGPYPASVRRRIAGSGGHLSNRAAAELAVDLHSDRLEAVILVHLSERCNRPDLALAAVTNALVARRFTGEVFVAGQNEPLEAVTVGGDPQSALSLPELPRLP